MTDLEHAEKAREKRISKARERTDHLHELQRMHGNAAVGRRLRADTREPVPLAKHHAFEFRIGAQVPVGLARVAKDLAGDAPLSRPQLRRLQRVARDHGGINEVQRMFLAGLLDAGNVRKLSRTPIKADTTIDFSLQSIRAGMPSVKDLGRSAKPAGHAARSLAEGRTPMRAPSSSEAPEQAPARRLQRQKLPAPPAVAQKVTPIVLPWSGSIRSSLFAFLTALGLGANEAARATRAVLDSATSFTLPNGRPVTRAEFEAVPRTTFSLDPILTELLAKEAGMDPARLRAEAPKAIASELERGRSQARVEGRTPPSREAQEREANRWVGASDPIRGDWALLQGNAPLARVYLRLMEHYVGTPQTQATRAAAADGLDESELMTLVGTDPTRRVYTNLFTQGWREYTVAGGKSVETFERLEERIFEQLAWGNSTAARNQLRIGFGSPEHGILGIADRSTGILLYDADGNPLDSFSGMMMRDYGYVAARQFDGIEIPIDDPALALLLNMLRQDVSDPMLMVGRGARAYMSNMDLVNARVRDGPPALDQQIINKFEEMFALFVGFVGGHALSTFLMASLNPVLAAVGATLKGLLVAAGYVMDIDFAAGAIQKLMDAGYHLSRVVKNPDDTLTDLSEHHLEEGATVIRDMVSDLAAMWLVREVGDLAGGSIAEAMRRREIERIECTTCRFKRRERRVRRRADETSRILEFANWTKARIEAVRRALRSRPDATDPREVRHTDARSSHGVDPAVMKETINNPEATGVSKNGSWVFYRRGVIVVTRPGDVNAVLTAYGRGANLPERHVADFNSILFPGKGPHDGVWRAGDPEPIDTSWDTFQKQMWGHPIFSFVRIWGERFPPAAR